MPSSIIFDIDGTIADCSHRKRFVEATSKDWDTFFDEAAYDGYIKPVVDMLIYLYPQNFIFLCTGRPEKIRAVTESWLDCGGIPYNHLYMRRDNDFRPDAIVKKEMLDAIRADGYDPRLAIDDRQCVVDMWRHNGLVCLQNIDRCIK